MRHFLMVAFVVAALEGCATPGERTAIGAGGGAAVGAGIGAIAGGWEGAAIGAVVGGIAGGGTCNFPDKQTHEPYHAADPRRTHPGALVALQSSPLFRP